MQILRKDKLKSGCIADGLPAPEFDIRTTMFAIHFRIRNNNKTNSEEQVYSAEDSGINSGINKVRKQILNIMQDDSSVTTQRIADILGIDRRNVESHVRTLKKFGVVEREGARKNGCWIVKRS
jgi:ATP-dependent DNA helicase RecG